MSPSSNWSSSDSSRSSSSDSSSRNPYLSTASSNTSSAPSSPLSTTSCFACPSPILNSSPNLGQVYLISPVFANPTFLHDLSSTLAKGSGDLVVLCAASLNANQSPGAKNVSLGEALRGVGVDIDEVGRGWMRVISDIQGEERSYFVSKPGVEREVYHNTQELGQVDDVLASYQSELDKEHKIPSHAELLNLLSLTSLRCIVSLQVQDRTIYVLERPAFTFPPLTSSLSLSLPRPSMDTQGPATDTLANNPFGVPTPTEWRELWAAWDLVTLGMIPPSMLHQKPIDLRHKCLFYIGHIPTFLDMLMSKALGEPNTEPKNYTDIFERGIDPHVDDPDHCHSHSEVPEADEDWPTLDDIIGFRDRVRARLMTLYDDLRSGRRTISRKVARMLVMTLEHEGFHVETLLYMLIQRAGTGTLPPPGFSTPPWSSLSDQWARLTPALASTTTTLGPTLITLGHDDSEADDMLPEFIHDIDGHEFGWDNESPKRAVEVGKFRIDWRPVSNAEFCAFWRGEGQGKVDMPKSWVDVDGSIKVRTLYGPVSMDIAKDWPVLASYDDLMLYAQHKGGRIPTEPELRLFFDTYEVGGDGGANVGFRNWHPIPPTTGGEKDNGRGSNGGVWEWTTTVFEGHQGLVPTAHFTGYSTDFFDGKHYVVLGASYATIPRLASRRTLRNFYQHNYPYPWVSARVAYDL